MDVPQVLSTKDNFFGSSGKGSPRIKTVPVVPFPWILNVDLIKMVEISELSSALAGITTNMNIEMAAKNGRKILMFISNFLCFIMLRVWGARNERPYRPLVMVCLNSTTTSSFLG